MGNLIKNEFQGNYSEKDEKNINFNNKNGIYNKPMDKYNVLNQKKLGSEKESEENINKNKLINSNKKLQKQINDLKKSINNYEEILREKDNKRKKIIN